MPRPTSRELTEKSELAEQGLKRCRACLEVLPLDKFGTQARSSDGLQPRCKPCTNSRNVKYRRVSYDRDPEKYRAKALAYYHKVRVEQPERHSRRVRAGNLRKYGLSVEEFDLLLQYQGGKCAICKEDLQEGRGRHVDHCHETGKVRGVLCNLCNVGLGAFRDRPDLLQAAAAYL